MATCPSTSPRSEEHTSELQSHRDLHSFPTRRSSDLSPEFSGERFAQRGPHRRDRKGRHHPRRPPCVCRRVYSNQAARRVRRASASLRNNQHQLCQWQPVPQPHLDRKSTRLNSSHTEIYTLSLHDALPIYLLNFQVKDLPSEDLTGATVKGVITLDVRRAYVAGSIPIKPHAAFAELRRRYEITSTSFANGNLSLNLT